MIVTIWTLFMIVVVVSVGCMAIAGFWSTVDLEKRVRKLEARMTELEAARKENEK